VTSGFDRGIARIDMAGTGALLLDCAEDVFSQDRQRVIWAVAKSARQIPGVRECVPGMNNLMVVFDPLACDPDRIEATLQRMWREISPAESAGRQWTVQVQYGGAGGEDLALISRHAKLTIDEFVRRHSEATYSVAAIGAMAGFPYLSGLDPRLACPRRANPRLRVEEGAVIVGGTQASIMPCAAPSGWHIIGKASFPLFDPRADPPAKLQPGDTVRFTIGGVER
jgi:KipI family sensor histidine kinase inhibitor